MAENFKKIITEKKKEAGSLMSNKQLSDCNIAIHTASVAAAAGGILPLPGVDAIPISTAQVTMVLVLGKIFDQKITESAAKGIISAAASTFVGRNLVKLIPVVGWGVSAAVAAGVTEAIGWTIAVDFSRSYKKDEALKESTEVEKRDSVSDEWDEHLGEIAVEINGDDRKSDDEDDESIINDFEKAFGEEEQL